MSIFLSLSVYIPISNNNLLKLLYAELDNVLPPPLLWQIKKIIFNIATRLCRVLWIPFRL